MDKQNDERYINVDEAICDSLFLIAAQKEPSTISVADICKKAGIVRSTFYNHYQDMPSLIHQVQSRSVKEVFQLMENFHPHGDREICESFYLSLCFYVAENSLIQQLLKWPDASASFYREAIEMFHAYVMKISGRDKAADRQKKKMDSLETDSAERLSYAIAYSIGGAIGILHKWTTDGLKADPDTVASALTDMFLQGPMAVINTK